MRRGDVAENDVTSALPINFVSELAKSCRKLPSRNPRQLAHRLTSTTSSSTDGGMGSSCALRLSRYAAIASCTLARASARVEPCVTQPGKDGASATKTPSSPRSTRTRNFIALTAPQSITYRRFLRRSLSTVCGNRPTETFFGYRASSFRTTLRSFDSKFSYFPATYSRRTELMSVW